MAHKDMFARTHAPLAPWTAERADHKKLPRLNGIKDLLTHLKYKSKHRKLIRPNPDILFTYAETYLDNGMIAP